jgi:hypothetical protein
MKKLVNNLAMILVLFASCKKAGIITYDSSDNVYFDLNPYGYQDSILYTFAYEPELLTDTVYVPVRISGNRVPTDRSYQVKVVESATTAVVNEHFEPLKESYSIAAGEGGGWLPVILFNTDTLLLTQSFVLTLQLEGTGDLGVEHKDIITARLVFSNKLEQPFWWTMWLGTYYSQVKHQLFRLAATTDDLTTEGMDAPRNTYYVDKLNSLLNNPFNWVNSNPDKGYVLEQRPDGDYDFYYEGTPEKKILYKKNESSGKYYFIDEYGKEVI